MKSYLTVLILSILFLFVGNRIASHDLNLIDEEHILAYYSGVVTEIIGHVEGDIWFHEKTLYFNARITDGDLNGEVVEVQQTFTTFEMGDEREVEVGDKIVILYRDTDDHFVFVRYVRINYIIGLAVVFFALVVGFGRMKGFNGIVSLGFSCVSVFMVFIPAILSGRNIYASAIIVCAFSIISTLLLVIGVNKKALSAMLGCFGGVALAGLLMIVSDAALELTGAINHETAALLTLQTPAPLDLRAVIFAGIIFGSVGAIMDVAMSISSALWEVRETGGVSDFKSLVKSGITIGQDTLGTMLNTLVLAYIGSSLSIILLFFATETSHIVLFNRELIIVEFLRALVGSFGMLLTIPLTAAICAKLYMKKDDETPNDDEYYERIRRRIESRKKKEEKKD